MGVIVGPSRRYEPIPFSSFPPKNRRGLFPLDHPVSKGIKAVVLSLGLAAMVRADGFPAQNQPAADSLATLLGLPPAREAFEAGIPVSAGARGKTDRAARPVMFQSSAPIEGAASNAQELPPPIAPLPRSGVQPAQVPSRDQRPPAPPSPGTVREAPAGRQAQPRPAATGAQPQDIQFDPNGLVTHFHVNEGDLRQILELLSRRAGMNILVSPGVTGTVTVNFENVTVDQVLQAVIRLANLVKKTEGSIHYIYTKGEVESETEALKKERILTKVYKLNYVRSDEMMLMIRPFLSADVGLKRFANTPSYRFGISESVTFVSGAAASGGAGGGDGRLAAVELAVAVGQVVEHRSPRELKLRPGAIPSPTPINSSSRIMNPI